MGSSEQFLSFSFQSLVFSFRVSHGITLAGLDREGEFLTKSWRWSMKSDLSQLVAVLLAAVAGAHCRSVLAAENLMDVVGKVMCSLL